MTSSSTDVMKSPNLVAYSRMLEQLKEMDVKAEPEYGDDCNHDLVVTDDAGIPTCMDCGIMFMEKRQYAKRFDEYGQVNCRTDSGFGNDVPIGGGVQVKVKQPKGRPKGSKNKPKPPKPPRDESPPPTNPRNVKDLRKIAKHRGLKYHTTMSKKDLCEALGVELIKPIKYLFTDKETGEEIGFHSIYKASKDMGINLG